MTPDIHIKHFYRTSPHHSRSFVLSHDNSKPTCRLFRCRLTFELETSDHAATANGNSLTLSVRGEESISPRTLAKIPWHTFDSTMCAHCESQAQVPSDWRFLARGCELVFISYTITCHLNICKALTTFCTCLFLILLSRL